MTDEAVERVAKAIYAQDMTWVGPGTSFQSWEETAVKDIYLDRAAAAIVAMEGWLLTSAGRDRLRDLNFVDLDEEVKGCVPISIMIHPTKPRYYASVLFADKQVNVYGSDSITERFLHTVAAARKEATDAK